MPGTDDLVAGAPAWVDVTTTDLDRTVAFYESVFGWTAERGDERYGGYVTFRHDGNRVAGAALRQETDPAPPHWTVYLLSYNAAATSERIARPMTPISGMSIGSNSTVPPASAIRSLVAAAL